MKTINIYNAIANNQDTAMLSMIGIQNTAFSADTLKNIFAESPQETDFTFNIHSNGGSVSEGLAIYDILRNSGKNIYMNIEGSCHSMAVTLLLAAPKQNRTANANARALIHPVNANPGNVNLSTIDILKQEIQREQDTILNIYASRTGTNRNILENLMKQEKQITAQELLQYGFISKINTYNTNYNKNMNKTFFDKLSNWKRSTRQLLNDATLIFNYDFTDEDGNTIFSTSEDDDSLSIGMPVTIPDGTTDGTFTLADGTVVTIKNNKISDIQQPDDAQDPASAQLQNKLRTSYNLINQLQQEITSLKRQITSNYKAPTRITNARINKAHKSKEDWKTEMIERTAKK